MNKHDSEWAEGILVGLPGISNEILVSTPEGVVKCRDIRQMVKCERWDAQYVLKCNTNFEQYVDPEVVKSEPVVINAEVPNVAAQPETAEPPHVH